MSTAANANNESLHFAESKSKAVGVTGSLMDKLHENAPRVVGVLKSIGDIAGGMVGHPFMIAFAAFGLIGRSFMIMWGTKEHQATLVAEQKTDQAAPLGNSLTDSLKKVTHPRQYPMEASAGFSLVAESCGAAFGVAELIQGNPGWTPLVLGILAVWSYSNILFKKEAKKEDQKKEPHQDSLVFSQSESKQVGFISKVQAMMKDNPVLVSSVTNIGICAAAFILSCFEGMQPQYLIYLSIGVGANLVQALLVRKNDYNVEGIKDNDAQAKKPIDANAPMTGHLAGRIEWRNTHKAPSALHGAAT